MEYRNEIAEEQKQFRENITLDILKISKKE